MFDEDDPLLIRLRELALGLPEAAEKISHGRPAFYTAKVFAYYGGSIKVAGEYQQHSASLVIKPDAAERLALIPEPRCYAPAYLGPSGWIGLDLSADTDWGEVAELLELSYRETASRSLVGQLDAHPRAAGG
ncbi:MAG: MmcQ/YjbR family DNA-binding protein, partial [Micrococcales bacterium]|nr:MmcQ/YjbR family DNA-binding protein [Micrococcales bacterium]